MPADKISALIGFHVLIFVLLAIDLGVFHKKAHAIGTREALGWSIVWVALSALFCVCVGFAYGRRSALEFATAYIIEKSLSVDNIFVFVVLFGALAVPPIARHRVLYWGVLGAILLRGPMIYLGNYFLHRLHFLIYFFGAFLVYTGVKIVLVREEDEPPSIDDSKLVRFVRRLIPTTSGFRDARLFVREGGRLLATPLFATLVIIELSDVMFALDSIPAVLAMSDDFFIMYTSNIFAILGLRALFFLVAASIERFRYLKPALAFILVFVGVKMLGRDVLEDWITPGGSLAVIVLTLAVAGLGSAVVTKREARRARVEGATPPAEPAATTPAEAKAAPDASGGGTAPPS